MPAAALPHPVFRTLKRLFGALFSFEALFALFLYSNNIKPFLPSLPVDETILFGAASLPFAGFLLWRRGLPARGLPATAIGLLLFGWLALSMLWSPAQFLAARAVAYNLTFNLYCLLAGALVLAADRLRVRRFLVFVLLVALFLSVHGFWIYLQYGTFRFYSGFEGIQAYLLWTFPVSTASAIPLTLALTAPLGTLRQIVSLALALFFGAFLLVASARGPMLAYLFSFFFPLLIHPPRVGHGSLQIPAFYVFLLFLTSSLLLLLLGFLASGDVPPTVERFIDLLGYIRAGGVAVRFDRLSYWYHAIQFWSRSPLFGIGIGGFSYLYAFGREIPGTHPHNVVLELLAETGLVGAFLFFTLLRVSLRDFSIRRLHHDRLYLCIFLMFVGLLVVRAMTSTDLANQWELFLTIGLLTLPPAPSTAHHAVPSPSRPSSDRRTRKKGQG
ncbi:MAG: O-antigen ligase family protein [Geminicoccaceae bacterium]|nr:O-antigen ligase family protein [Geminicoccaceae bacterium]